MCSYLMHIAYSTGLWGIQSGAEEQGWGVNGNLILSYTLQE